MTTIKYMRFWCALSSLACLVLAGCGDGNGPSLQDRLVLGQLFSVLDSDGDGVLKETDFSDMGRTYRLDGQDQSASEAKSFYFGRCDSDQNSEITRDEFFDCMR